MGAFRFAHLSDLHIAARPMDPGAIEWWHQDPKSRVLLDSGLPGLQQTFNHDVLLRAIEELLPSDKAAGQSPLDFLLITGDIATTGRACDLYTARYFVNGQNPPGYVTKAPSPEQLKLYFGRRLSEIEVPIVLVPGNHDRYKNERGTPGCDRFENAFRKEWNPSSRLVERVILNTSGDARIGVICADFSLPEETGIRRSFVTRFGQGIVLDSVLNDLESRTRQLMEKGIPVIWAIHFSPDSRYDRNLALLGSAKLVECASRVGVNYVFCGHTHEQTEYAYKSYETTRFLCAGTTCGTYYWHLDPSLQAHEATEPRKDANHFRVIDMEENGGKIDNIRIQDFVYVISDTQDEFVPHTRPAFKLLNKLPVH